MTSGAFRSRPSRRSFCLSSLGFLAVPSVASSSSASLAAVTISTEHIGTVGPEFVGLSYEKNTLSDPHRLFRPDNSALVRSMRLLGPGILRIGGISVDQSLWSPNGPGKIPGQISPSDIDSLAQFLKAVGWRCLYGINLGGAGPNPFRIGAMTAKTTPTLAADEVAAVSAQLGNSLMGIEIGNECDGYGSTCFKGASWNLEIFEQLWLQFRDAILAHTPHVTITGPANGSNIDTWTIPFAKWATKNRIQTLTQHYYRGDGHSPQATAPALLTANPRFQAAMGALRQAAQSTGIPFRLSECNSYFNGGASGVSNTYASALWAIDFLFSCAAAECNGVNFHGGGPWPGYTPIADFGGYVQEVRPEFYGAFLFALAGQGTLLQTKIDAGPLNVSAYTVQSAGGNLHVVVSNKDENHDLRMTVKLPKSVRAAEMFVMNQTSPGSQKPQLTATTGIELQGATILKDGSFTLNSATPLHGSGSQFSCSVPALSAVLIRTS